MLVSQARESRAAQYSYRFLIVLPMSSSNDLLQQARGSGQCREGANEEGEKGSGECKGEDGELDSCHSLGLFGTINRLLEDHIADNAEVVRYGEDAVYYQRRDGHVDEDRPGLCSGEDDPGFTPESA